MLILANYFSMERCSCWRCVQEAEQEAAGARPASQAEASSALPKGQCSPWRGAGGVALWVGTVGLPPALQRPQSGPLQLSRLVLAPLLLVKLDHGVCGPTQGGLPGRPWPCDPPCPPFLSWPPALEPGATSGYSSVCCHRPGYLHTCPHVSTRAHTQGQGLPAW